MVVVSHNIPVILTFVIVLIFYNDLIRILLGLLKSVKHQQTKMLVIGPVACKDMAACLRMSAPPPPVIGALHPRAPVIAAADYISTVVILSSTAQLVMMTQGVYCNCIKQHHLTRKL